MVAPAAAAAGTGAALRAALTERRNPALADARFRAEHGALKTRIHDAPGGVGDSIVDEQLADGTLKLRRGTSCVLVHPSRAAGIDPFNEAFRKKARGVESCR